MEIILLVDYNGLGEAGDVIKVKPGFARNKLIPEGIALRASKRNVSIAKEQRKINKNRLEREVANHEALAKKLSKIEITIEAQVGEEDKMFGSITNKDIQRSLKEKGVEVNRGSILMEGPIKSLGIYHITVNVTKEINADVKVYVIKS